ncbi:MAG: LacI family DNA-binding transcriptional regulator [Spirochaetaceae bacterium]
MVKLKDVAQKAGVSEATASLVLNERPGVHRETRKKVFQAAEELGYTPNAIARNLATRRSRTIGLVVTDISNPFFGNLTKYVDQFVKERGYGLILSLSEDDLSKEDGILQDFVGKMVEGIIVVPTLSRPPREAVAFDRLRRLSVPFVFASSYYLGVQAECVMGDLAGGSYLLTRHLLQAGRRRIRFLSVEELEVVPVAERLRGIRKAMEEWGVPVEDALVVPRPEPNYEAGYAGARELLRAGPPDAIMAMNDIMALGALRALLDEGCRVPDEVVVAGYDDLIYSQIAQVPLTTVRQNIEEIARRAVDRLFELMKGGSSDAPETPILVQTELITRISTAAPGTGAGLPTR